MAKPLNKLKRKKKWKWEEHQKAFKELKHVLQSIVSVSAHLSLPMGSIWGFFVHIISIYCIRLIKSAN